MVEASAFGGGPHDQDRDSDWERLRLTGRAPGEAFQRVRIVEHVRGTKWKAEWIDPNPGLVHYVESSALIVRWKDQKAFLKEEENDVRPGSTTREVG